MINVHQTYFARHIYFEIETQIFIFRTRRCHLLHLALALFQKLETARFFAVDEFNALVTLDNFLSDNALIMQLNVDLSLSNKHYNVSRLAYRSVS